MSFPLQPLLRGPTLELRPLRADDFETLYEVARDPLIWAQHPARDRWRREVYAGWFAEAMASGGALVVIERASGAVIGSSRYYDWDADRREIAIGFTFLACAFWGGAANRELKKLMTDHAFAHAQLIWFHVAPDNLRSRKAMEKIGGVLSHQGLKQMPSGPVDYCFYKLERPL